MEASDGMVRGNVDSLTKLIAALEAAGIKLIAENAVGQGGGRGVRFKIASGLQNGRTTKCAKVIPIHAA